MGDDPRSHALAREYTTRVFEVYPGPSTSPRVLRVEETGRGAVNLRHVVAAGIPCCLLEPGYVSNREFAIWADSPEGVTILAGVLARVLRLALPEGGVIALSVGHVGQTSDPTALGAPVCIGGWESDIAARVIEETVTLLSAM